MATWRRLLRATGAVPSLGIVHCGRVASIDDTPCPCVAGYTCCSGACVAGATCPAGTTPGDDGGDNGAEGGASQPPGSSDPADAGGEETAPANPDGTEAAPCPIAEPTVGEPCVPNSLGDLFCVYGPYVQDDCNNRYLCGNADPRFGVPNTWYLDPGQNHFGCARKNSVPLEATACPATYADVPQGQACDAYEDDLSTYCSYPEGLCACTQGPGGNGPHHDYQWVCSPLPAGCPVRPPHTNQVCSQDGLLCDYGSCTMGWDVPVIDCFQGTWQHVHPTKSCI